MVRSSYWLLWVTLVVFAAGAPSSLAQESDSTPELPEVEVATAPVEVDGRVLTEKPSGACRSAPTSNAV